MIDQDAKQKDKREVSSLSMTMDYVDKCNSSPLETYLRLFADIFLSDEEYVYFMLAVANTGRIETKGGAIAYHVSDYINAILNQKRIEKVNKDHSSVLHGKGTDDPAVRAFCEMIEINFIERNTSAQHSNYQANASYLFNLKKFLITSFYNLDIYVSKLEAELKDPISMGHVKYHCEYCDKRFTEADLYKLNKNGNIKSGICPKCFKPRLTLVTKHNQDKDDTAMKKGMLSVLKELHALGKKIISEYMDKKENYYAVRLREFQNSYQNNFLEGQRIYNKCNNAAMKDIDEDDDESEDQEDTFTWLSANADGVPSTTPKQETTNRIGVQSAQGATPINSYSFGGKKRRRIDVTSTDLKSVFSKRHGAFWRSEKLGGMTVLGESTRKPKWFVAINEKAQRVLNRSKR
ncbi:Hypothetical protein GL50581_2351 [Giardia duodenalis ATCC 50581]|nr:Hypothetical protein GL50581_2351 [Giardia intestinalis ATCC 50581]